MIRLNETGFLYRAMLLLYMIISLGVGASVASSENSLEPKSLVTRADQLLRGESNVMEVELRVKTPEWERTYQLKSWMSGKEKAFSRVVSPASVKGQAFLKLSPRLWNFLPRAEKTILVPPSLMLQEFMGSDFSNDDFVRMSQLDRDYSHRMLREEKQGTESVAIIELMPVPEAAVVYGKLIYSIRIRDAAPLECEFYDEKLNKIRTLTFSEYRHFGDRHYPSVWRMINHREAGRETVIEVKNAEFNISVPEEVFTQDNLERAE